MIRFGQRYKDACFVAVADCGAFTFSPITNIPDGYRFDASALRRLRRHQKGSPK